MPNEAETPSTFRWVPPGPDVLDAAVPRADAQEGMRDEFTRVLGWSRSPPGSGLGHGESGRTHRDMAPTVGHGTGEGKALSHDTRRPVTLHRTTVLRRLPHRPGPRGAVEEPWTVDARARADVFLCVHDTARFAAVTWCSLKNEYGDDRFRRCELRQGKRAEDAESSRQRSLQKI